VAFPHGGLSGRIGTVGADAIHNSLGAGAQMQSIPRATEDRRGYPVPELVAAGIHGGGSWRRFKSQ
jgi:hypothetical protein